MNILSHSLLAWKKNHTEKSSNSPMEISFLWLLLKLFFSLAFDKYNVSSCSPIWSNYLGFRGASWILFICLPRFRAFSAVMTLNIISIPFFSPSGIPIMGILFLFMVSHKSYRLSSLLFSFCSSDLIISNVLSSN